MLVDSQSINGVPAGTVRALSPDAESLVLIVPGNPGVAQLYAPFIDHLVAHGGGRLSVAVASHAGHDPGHRAPNGFYSLADQHAHHLAFLEQLPATPTVHLVGHSIGAWLALGLLDALPEQRRGRALLLFPTIERMAQTPAGRRMSPMFGALRHPSVLLSRLIRRLPGRDRLLEQALLSAVAAEDRPVLLEGILKLSPESLHNVLLLAGEELATVIDLPEVLLERHAARLTLYYGRADRWNLPDMPRGVQERFPAAEVVRCSESISHAFMFGGSAAMAGFVAQRLQSDHALRSDR